MNSDIQKSDPISIQPKSSINNIDNQKDYFIEIIEPTETLEELESLYNKWKLMTYYQRKISDERSLEIFGKTNTQHYEELKRSFTNESNVEYVYSDSAIDKLNYDKSKVEDAIKWYKDSNIYIIIPQPSLNELEDLWNKWNSLHYDLRKKSDDKSIELFNMNNTEHYNILKSIFLNSKEYNNINLSDINNIIYNIEKERDSDNPDIIKIASLSMKLDNIDTNSISESINKVRCLKDTEIWFNNQICDIFDYVPDDLPYYTPDELIDMDIITPNILGDTSDENNNDIVSEKEWIESYILLSKGIISEDLKDNTNKWVRKLSELSFKLENNIGNKENIIEAMYKLGWNPKIKFTKNNRKIITEYTKSKLFKSFKLRKIDLSKFNINNNIVLKPKEKPSLYPVFIVLEYNDKIVAKLIRGFTSGKYTHAGIALDSSLTQIYTYNMRKQNGNNHNGFCIENIDEYRVDGDHPMVSVQCIFLKEKEYNKLCDSIKQFIANQKYTSYSFLTILSIIAKKEVQFDASMVCSQFVDFVLKISGINLINKSSNLVVPSDFYEVSNKKIYRIYEGLAKDYKKEKTDKLLYSLTYKAKFINESLYAINESQYIDCILENYNDINTLLYIDEKKNILSESSKYIYEQFISPFINIEPIYEVKQFPVKFDKDGNLFISKIKDMDYKEEYSKSHNLLLTYRDTNNIEGIKYELSKFI